MKSSITVCSRLTNLRQDEANRGLRTPVGHRAVLSTVRHAWRSCTGFRRSALPVRQVQRRTTARWRHQLRCGRTGPRIGDSLQRVHWAWQNSFLLEFQSVYPWSRIYSIAIGWSTLAARRILGVPGREWLSKEKIFLILHARLFDVASALALIDRKYSPPLPVCGSCGSAPEESAARSAMEGGGGKYLQAIHKRAHGCTKFDACKIEQGGITRVWIQFPPFLTP